MQQYNKVLEVKIKERTEELEKTNLYLKQEINEHKLAQDRQRQTNEELENKVKTRTVKLEQSYRNLRSLSARLEAFRQEEQISIPHEIHEVIGQPLTSLKIELALIKGKLPQKYERLHIKIEKMLFLLSSCMDKVRSRLTQLHPPILEDFGLVTTFKWVHRI